MTAPRQTISTDDLKSRLLGQIDHLVAQFAPEGPGSYHKGPLYFTLNPGRADRSVGSFCIHMSGPKAGRWVDYAVPGPEGQRVGIHERQCILQSSASAPPAQARALKRHRQERLPSHRRC